MHIESTPTIPVLKKSGKELIQKVNSRSKDGLGV